VPLACLAQKARCAGWPREGRQSKTRDGFKAIAIQTTESGQSTCYQTGQFYLLLTTMRELGGTMPEALPTPAQSIKQIESAKNKLTGK